MEALETVEAPETVEALDMDIPKHHVKSQTEPYKYLQIETDTFASESFGSLEAVWTQIHYVQSVFCNGLNVREIGYDRQAQNDRL